MQTIIFLVSVIVVTLFGCLAIVGKKDCNKPAFSVIVVAKWHSDFVVRDEKGTLYILTLGYAKDVKIEDEIMVERVPGRWQNEVNRVNVVTPPYYVVSKDENAKKAQVIRRLNEGLVFCRLGKDEIFVSCSLEKQQKYQSSVSMVVGIKSDGNDRQILKCQDVLELPVCRIDGTFVIPECRQV